MSVTLQTCCPIQRTSSSLRYVNCVPGLIQCIYISAYSDFNIHLNLPALLLEISRQFNACYNANLEPNTAHILQFTLCELWSPPYTVYLQLHIFRLQYSFEFTCAAIGDMPTFGCALYCNFDAIYSAQQPVRAMCIAVPIIYNVVASARIQSSVFN
jgi:hypothetical protein